MISFPCFCGEKFSLSDDMAGGMFQCTKCGRLVTIPTLDDIRHLQDDGTYDIDVVKSPVPTPPQEPETDAQAIAPPEEMIDVAPQPAPRYDPFTGELIREHVMTAHHLSSEQQRAPRTQPLSKMGSRGKIQVPVYSGWKVLIDLFQIRNLVVILIIFLLHIFVAIWVVCLEAGLFLVYAFGSVLVPPIVNQYSLIIQEIGPSEKDDLPTPLRNFQFQEDLWAPFVHLSLALTVCFAPALVWYCNSSGPLQLPITGLLAIPGMFLFPVVMLTASVDGTLANFRPDRMLGVIATAPVSYFATILAFAGGTAIYLDGLASQANIALRMFMHPDAMPAWPSPLLPQSGWIASAMILGGMYLQYYACWQLGLIWRAHHPKFPWIAQRFTDKKPVTIIKPPAKPVAAKSPESVR